VAQKLDPVKVLERRVRKLERALEAVIQHTGARAAVDEADRAAAEEQEARAAETRERFSQISRGQGRGRR
jgi:surface antigen